MESIRAMLKRENIYICNRCWKKAFPVRKSSSVFTIFEESIPDGWMTINKFFKKNEHLCPRCAEEYRYYRNFMEKTQKEEKI